MNFRDPSGLVALEDFAVDPPKLHLGGGLFSVLFGNGSAILTTTTPIANSVWIGDEFYSYPDHTITTTYFFFGVPSSGSENFSGGGGALAQGPVYKHEGPCDQSQAAINNGAQQVANSIAGARIGTEGGQTIIRFAGNFSQTVRQLDQAGYYRGIWAYDPLYHSGGLEFRTYGSPGFHLKVVFPKSEMVPANVRGGVALRPSNEPAIGTDLHIDCHNPVGAGWKERIKHGGDFMNTLPWWVRIGVL